MNVEESIAYAKQARNQNNSSCHECLRFHDCMNIGRSRPYNKFCSYKTSKFELFVRPESEVKNVKTD